MKILYGIQGTGNGHLARARALVPALIDAGIEMDFVFSGRDEKDFFNMDVFPHYRCFEGLSLATHKGKLSLGKTLQKNSLRQFIRDVKNLNVRGYDLVLSDFEPVTAWAAKIQGVRSIAISHQAAFQYAIPKLQGFHSARLLMRFFAPTNHHIGLHWQHFNQAILPPLIEPMRAKKIINNKIVVYMGFENLDDIISFIKPFTDYQFHIYAKVDAAKRIGHIHIKALNHEGFHADLLDCEGVISNAGFELASECISLGKKLLVKPLLGQYEQLSNAKALSLINRGTVIKSLDQKTLKQWLALPIQSPKPYPNVARALADWLLLRDFDNIQPLLLQLWPDGGPSNPHKPSYSNIIKPIAVNNAKHVQSISLKRYKSLQ